MYEQKNWDINKKKRKQYSSQFCTGTKHFKQSFSSFCVNEWYKLDS